MKQFCAVSKCVEHCNPGTLADGAAIHFHTQLVLSLLPKMKNELRKKEHLRHPPPRAP